MNTFLASVLRVRCQKSLNTECVSLRTWRYVALEAFKNGAIGFNVKSLFEKVTDKTLRWE
jgi:hypothetical protein